MILCYFCYIALSIKHRKPLNLVGYSMRPHGAKGLMFSNTKNIIIVCVLRNINTSAPFPVPIKTNRVYTIADYVVVTAT
jgi:hypothetical protein